MEKSKKSLLKTIALLAPIASAVFFGIKYVPDYVKKFSQDNEPRVQAVENFDNEYTTKTEKYQLDVESMIQLRDKIDAKLPQAELEKLVVRNLRTISPSALTIEDYGRIIQYALTKDKLGKIGAKTTYIWAKQSYERLKQKEEQTSNFNSKPRR